MPNKMPCAGIMLVALFSPHARAFDLMSVFGQGDREGHRQLQEGSGEGCVRNCAGRKCNFTETQQYHFCADTCACGKYEVGSLGIGNTGNWMPDCLVDTAPVKATVDGMCKGNRVVVSNLNHEQFNGEYRSASQTDSCGDGLKAGTVLQLHRELGIHEYSAHGSPSCEVCYKKFAKDGGCKDLLKYGNTAHLSKHVPLGCNFHREDPASCHSYALHHCWLDSKSCIPGGGTTKKDKELAPKCYSMSEKECASVGKGCQWAATKPGAAYLYFAKEKGANSNGDWFISPKPCETHTFTARLSPEEGAAVSDKVGSITDLTCQLGFEGRCGWRECMDKDAELRGSPNCVESQVPNTEYGFIRMPYNRAAQIRTADASVYGHRKCLGDFNQDKTVDVKELMEVLGAFGVSSCAVRADLDHSCSVNVHDVLVLLGGFGDCDQKDKDRVAEYQLSKVYLSGFAYEGANGHYEKVTCDKSKKLCAQECPMVTVNGKATRPTTYKRQPTPQCPEFDRCLASGQAWCKSQNKCLTGNISKDSRCDSCGDQYDSKNIGCGGSKCPYTDAGDMYLYASSSPTGTRQWYVGEQPCRYDVAYARMDFDKYNAQFNGTKREDKLLDIHSLPCQQGDKTKPCFWDRCSKGQYLWASCEMDCSSGKNCPPLLKTHNVQVVPLGTSSDGR